MQYKRNITEVMLYLFFLMTIVFLYEETIFAFLTNEHFLNVLTTSAVTLSGLGVTLLGIILVLPEPESADGIEGRISIRIERGFLAVLKRSTAYFLLSSFFAFLCYGVPNDILVALVACSAFSTILFLSGLLHLLYVCFNIEKLARVTRTRARG